MSIARHTLTIGTLVLIALLAALAAPLRAERPSAPKLLPKNTLGFMRITDVRELAEKHQQTQLGRILNDEEIKPFLLHLYGSAADAFEQLQDQVGVSLPDLMKIPSGEICFAVVAPENGPLAVVMLMDVGKDSETVSTLIEKAEEALANNGARRTTEKVGDTELIIHEDIGDGRGVIHCVKDGTIVISSDRSVMDDLLVAWSGADKNRESLLDNRKFVTIMRRCSGTKDERPQISFYADPLELARVATRGNFGAQTALALVPALGLDGLQGIGGGMIMAPEEFDSIGHFHILLDNPRTGLIEAFSFKPGDLTPEPWVPDNAMTYMSVNWDVQKTYELLNKMVNEFNGEGVFDQQIERRINEPLGIDLKLDVIDVIDGRLTLVQTVETPVRLNSTTTMVGIKFKDVAHFSKVLGELMDKYEEQFTKKSVGSTTMYRFRLGENDATPGNLRRPEPCMAVVGDYLLISDSTKSLERAITTKGNASNSLANSLDYKLIASKIGQQTRNAKPAMITFSRPEESMRWMYDLVQSEDTRAWIADRTEENPALGAFSEALKDQPLPKFEAISRYLAPSGGMMISDETGLHFTSFALRRK